MLIQTVQPPNRDTCPNREKGLPRADLRFAATKKKNNIKLQEEASSYCWRPESGYQLFLQQWFWYQSGGSPSLRCWFWLSVGWSGAWETETTTSIPGSIQPGAGRPHPTHKPHLYALFRFHRMYKEKKLSDPCVCAFAYTWRNPLLWWHKRSCAWVYACDYASVVRENQTLVRGCFAMDAME